MRASSARFISFAHPPLLITKQNPIDPPFGWVEPKPGGKTCGFCLGAANLPKAVACGYSEGAGFACSNGTLPLVPWPFCALWATTRRRGVGEAYPRPPRVCALGCLYTLGWATGHWQPPSAEATPRWRRAPATPPDGVGMVGSQSTWALGLCPPESAVRRQGGT